MFIKNRNLDQNDSNERLQSRQSNRDVENLFITSKFLNYWDLYYDY